MAGALALAAVFMIACVEMVFSPGKNGCAMPHALMEANLAKGNHHAVESSHDGEEKGVKAPPQREGEGRREYCL